jgi:hypothetical protein
MKHELLLVLALALDVAGVVTVFVTSACASLKGGGVLRHAGTSPAATSGVKRGTDGASRGPKTVPSSSPNRGKARTRAMAWARG